MELGMVRVDNKMAADKMAAAGRKLGVNCAVSPSDVEWQRKELESKSNASTRNKTLF